MTTTLRCGDWRRRFGAALVTSLLLAIAGCHFGGDGDDDAPLVQVSATIGPAGGTVEGPDGVRVDVPPRQNCCHPDRTWSSLSSRFM